MTQKERFVRTLRFESVDRVPFMEIALWQQTKARWVEEGLPPEVDSAFMRGNDYFGLEGYDTVNIDAISPRPAFESRTIEETEDSILFIDSMGRTRKARKSGTVGGQRMCMDQYIDFAVNDRQSFADLKKRYEGPAEERYPDGWDDVLKGAKETDKPLTLLDPLSGTFGYYSMLRNWMGTERLSYMFFDDPGLVHECLDLLSEFAIRLLTKAVTELDFSFYFVHEDMAGKGGPLMSPALFRKFLSPHYKRFIEFLKSNGVEIILVDTDGDFEALIPEFLDAGVDGFGPMEVASGMDVARMRKQYGKSFSMTGGVDKREIAKGRREIEAEIDKIRPVLEEGGYIPMIDHAVQPEVSLDNFRYYLDLKRKAIFE